MPVITLTSDWKLNDYYIGAVKGRILNQCPAITIVDIAHQIPTFNLQYAAFILKNAYHQYPEGTIHIVGVNTVAYSDRPHVAIKADGHFFIGCDNGIFGLILKKEPECIVLLKRKEEESTFPGLYSFVDAACHLASGKKITDLGKQVGQFAKHVPLRAAIDESVITGSVIYIDSYQNAITNITRELFDRVGKKRPFEILVTSNYYKINSLNKTYGESPVGEILALFNSLNLLEIAINNGNAANLLNLSSGSGIRVQFRDEKSRKK